MKITNCRSCKNTYFTKLFSLGKMSFKPWVFNEPLFVSSFGTLEPDRKKKDVIPDIILVPLVAYDSKLNRIGYGKGYYDRILQEFSKTPTFVMHF